MHAIVTDIEGTTSSISFVHDVLFPYAAEHLPAFVRDRADEPEVAAALDETARAAGIDRRDTDVLVRQLLDWIAEDRKITPLKTLQGLIWEAGYRRGDYRAHIYPDAAECLREWHRRGIPLYVYSSGSKYAQQLFFSHTEAGDLSFLFSGYFDTTIGAKREPDAYRRIADEIGFDAGDIVFLSDVRQELDAAREVGMKTYWVIRGDQCEGGETHTIINDFSEVAV